MRNNLTVALGVFSCCTTLSLSALLAQDWELGPTGSQASFRAIACPSSEVLWIGGSQGTILKSTDAGDSWQNCNPSGYAEVEFRSLHAWDERRACAASAGSPAVILLTEDGGENWSLRYKNDAKTAFFDGLVFWDADHAVAVSDPVDGRWLMVETKDGGQSWQEIALVPEAVAGEAAFAASNSALIVGKGGAAWFGTGGVERPTSRIYWRPAAETPWQAADCPLPSYASSGVFSLAAGNGLLVAVGGDYRPDAESVRTAAWSDDLGKSWQVAEVQPPAYRSSVVAIADGLGWSVGDRRIFPRFIATGPTGSDYSLDGRRWVNFTEAGFHALTTTGDRIYAVGSDGRFGRILLQHE